MAHSAAQNANNRVGRNSGAGPDGVTRLVPTEREAERGLEPIALGNDHGWRRFGVAIGVGAGVSALALIGAGAAWNRVRHRPRGVRSRLTSFVGRA